MAVYPVKQLDALSRLTCRMMPDVVVLPADGADSGWLTRAKLLRAIPRLRVIVVGELTADTADLARFVGAEAVATVDDLADRIEGGIAVQTA